MGLCNDGSNTFLRDVGYNVVRLPRDFLPPLSLITRQNDAVEFIGGIDNLISNPGTLPAITTNQVAASVNGESSSSMKFSIGLSILNGIISGLGGGKLGANIGFTNARKITFEFNNVLFDSVAPLQVGNFLRNGDVDADNPVLKQFVLGNGKLYVVTERLKSAEITAKFEVGDGVNANVDVPVISGAIGGSVGAELASGRTNAVTFKGTNPITFGFKCFQIGLDHGEITMFSVRAGAVPMSLHEEPEAQTLLSDGLLDID